MINEEHQPSVICDLDEILITSEFLQRNSHKSYIIGVCYTKLRVIGDCIVLLNVARSEIVAIEAEFDGRSSGRSFQREFVSGAIGYLKRSRKDRYTCQVKYFTQIGRYFRSFLVVCD